MKNISLEEISEKNSMQNLIQDYFLRFTSIYRWKFYLSICLPMLVLFFATPSFQIIQEHWDPILVQSKNPFKQYDYPAHSHASKLAFRFVPAVIIGFLHLKTIGIIVWQYLNGIFLFYVVGYVVEFKTKSKLTAIYSILLTAFIFTGKVSFINFKDTFDSLILALILLCFVFSNKFLIYSVILLVGFTDERGLICSGFLFLYYLIFSSQKVNKTSVLLTILISWISYILIRLGLSHFLGLTTSTGGFDFKTMALNFNFSPLSLWQVFEGGWIIVSLFLIYLFKNNIKSLLLLLGQIIIVVFVAFLVFDVTRSLVYLFPLFIIAICVLNDVIKIEKLNYYMLLSVFISFIYPAYCSAGDTNNWLLPLPLKLVFEYFTN